MFDGLSDVGSFGGEVYSTASDAAGELGHDSRVAQSGTSAIRQWLKAAKAQFPQFSAKLNPVIGSLGLLSVVNVLTSPNDVVGGCKEVAESYRSGDREGVMLATAGIGLTIGWSVESMMSLNTSLNALSSGIPVLPIVSKFFLPLDVALTVAGIGLKTHKIYQTGKVFDKIERFEKTIEGETLEQFVLRITGETFHRELKGRVTQEKPQETKEVRQLLRLTSEKVVRCFQSLKNGETEKLEQIKTFVNRKIRVGYVDQVANAVMLVALAIFMVSLSASSVPYVLISGVILLKLGIYVYEKKTIYRGLNLLNLERAVKSDL